jgi:predicted amidophosphoribosyltransferase
MENAHWVECPGVRNEGREAHMMRDYCTSCAPFWATIPLCPHCGMKLEKVGKTKCKGCGRFVKVVAETDR